MLCAFWKEYLLFQSKLNVIEYLKIYLIFQLARDFVLLTRNLEICRKSGAEAGKEKTKSSLRKPVNYFFWNVFKLTAYVSDLTVWEAFSLSNPRRLCILSETAEPWKKDLSVSLIDLQCCSVIARLC